MAQAWAQTSAPIIIVNPSVTAPPGCISSVPVPDPSVRVCGCYDSTCGDLAYCDWFNGWYEINKFNCQHQYHYAQVVDEVCLDLNIQKH